MPTAYQNNRFLILDNLETIKRAIRATNKEGKKSKAILKFKHKDKAWTNIIKMGK